jgi:hypothetical protein
MVTSAKDVTDAVTNARKVGRKFVLVRILRSPQFAMFITLPVEEKK